MKWNEFFAAVAAVIGLLILIGGALALVKGSYNKARIQALREDNEDLRNRVDDWEDRLEVSTAKEKELAIKVEHLEAENTLLTEMVTQRADVDQVLNLLNKHHHAAMLGQARLTEAITLMTDRLERK